MTSDNNISNAQGNLPPGTKRIVTFDTNVYRQLGREKAKALRQREREAGVFALANPTVIQELAAHLAEKTDPVYDSCASALAAVAEHTWSPDNPDAGVYQYANARLAICHQLFHVKIPDEQQRMQDLGTVAAHVKDNSRALTDPLAIENFKRCADFVKQQEQQWIKMIKEVLATNTTPPPHAWIYATATLTVMTHAVLIGRSLSPDELREKTEMLIKLFPTPFLLAANVIQRVEPSTLKSLDKPGNKWGNYIWDYYICFAVGPDHEIGNAKVYLVTDDGWIEKAAVSAGCGDRVISIEDHMKSVGFN